MPPESAAFRVLDFLADSVGPGLALLALLAPVIRRASGSWGAVLRYYVASGIAVALVYIVQAIDSRFGLWFSLGLDYSTHTAFAVTVVTSACFWNRRWLQPLLAILIGYAALILLLGYHGIVDILTAAAVSLAGTVASHSIPGGLRPSRR
jgi:hypothetical protein